MTKFKSFEEAYAHVMRVHAATPKSNGGMGERKKFPVMPKTQSANECAIAEKRRNKVEWYIIKHPGCNSAEISRNLDLSRNTVANDIGWLRARKRVHSMKHGQRWLFHAGPKPERMAAE